MLQYINILWIEIIPISVGSNILGSSIVQQLPEREIIEDHYIWREDSKSISIYYLVRCK